MLPVRACWVVSWPALPRSSSLLYGFLNNGLDTEQCSAYGEQCYSASERRSLTWFGVLPEPPGRTAHEGGRPDGHHDPMGPVPGPAQRAGRDGPDEPDARP